MIVDSGGKEQKHVNVLVDINVTKALLRGTKIRHKHSECWVEFKYENFPLFCFDCSCVRHNEKGCAKRRLDVTENRVLQDQFGYWLRAGFRRGVGMTSRGYSERNVEDVILMKNVDVPVGGVRAAEHAKLPMIENLEAGMAGKSLAGAEKGKGRLESEKERVMVSKVEISSKEGNRVGDM